MPSTKMTIARRAGLLLFPLLFGCGGQSGPAEPRVAGLPPGVRPPASTSAAALPPPARREEDTFVPDPESRRLFLAGISRPSVAPSSGPPPHVTDLALKNTALGEAADMAPSGSAVTAVLAAGQRVTVPTSFEPGECATFIAQGGLGVIEVDLFLTKGEGQAAEILAQDLASGPIAVIGGRRGCFQGPASSALVAQLHAIVRRGGGPVVVQRFRR